MGDRYNDIARRHVRKLAHFARVTSVSSATGSTDTGANSAKALADEKAEQNLLIALVEQMQQVSKSRVRRAPRVPLQGLNVFYHGAYHISHHSGLHLYHSLLTTLLLQEILSTQELEPMELMGLIPLDTSSFRAIIAFVAFDVSLLISRIEWH
jgi:hypothetical protein